MKFGKQLRFIAVKTWDKHYIQYKQFKKMLLQMAAEVNEARENGKSEDEILQMKKEHCVTFKEALTQNVNESIQFYCDYVTQTSEKVEAISQNVYAELEKQTPQEEDTAIQIHKKIFITTLNLYEIRTFLEVNHSATSHIIKKFCKKLQYQEAHQELDVLQNDCFENMPTIQSELSRLEELYILLKRKIYPKGDGRPRQEIILELHKSVRNNLDWKQATVLGQWDAYTFRQNEFQLSATPIKIIPIIIAFVCMIPFLVYNFFGEGKFEAQRCLGVLIFCAILWCTTAVPLWLTSLSIPFFGVICRLKAGVATSKLAAEIQKATMSSTVYLIIGGFTIAAAFQVTEMDKRIASFILKKATGSTGLYLYAVIALNTFLAMWINNVASTMIVCTLVLQTLNQLPSGSNYAKLLLLGIAAGGNCGGLMTPLASPQNAIAVESVNNVLPVDAKKRLGFIEFMVTAIPTGLCASVVYWFIIRFVYKPDVNEVPKFVAPKTDFGWRQIVVSVVSLITIIIWIVLPFEVHKVFGDSGIIGFIPLLIFYGTGILPPSQIAKLPWNILFLVMGGNALGYVVRESTLLTIVSDLLEKLLGKTSTWVTFFIISLFELLINVFISHTVSATIILPIICKFAQYNPHLILYTLGAVAATTASQIMPVSSFPNLCCTSLQDKNGKEFIDTKDMMKSGAIATTVSFVFCITILFGFGMLLGL